MRVCLITPGHLSTNPRLVKEADALVEEGYEVRVLATDFIPWAREQDLVFGNRTWLTHPATRFGPDAPPLARVAQVARQRSARLLVSAGLRHRRLVEAAWHPIAPDLARKARRTPAQLYIAHYPAALPAAAAAAAEHGAQYAYDAEDFHVGDEPDTPQYELHRLMVRSIERRYLPGCAYVTAASPGIARAYCAEYDIPLPQAVLNVFPLSRARVEPTAAGSATPGPSIYWFSQTIGPRRGLEGLVQAIGLCDARPHLYLRGNVTPIYADALRTLAESSGAAGRLHLLPPAAPDCMEHLAARYDLGFVGEIEDTPNHRIAWSNKQFSYLLAGLPIIMSDTPGNRLFHQDAKEAVSLFPQNDPRALAAAIDDLLQHPRKLMERRAAALRLAHRRFNWDIEKQTFLDQVRRALGRA